MVDKDVNLYDLMPLFRLNRGDGAFFIDKAVRHQPRSRRLGQ